MVGWPLNEGEKDQRKREGEMERERERKRERQAGIKYHFNCFFLACAMTKLITKINVQKYQAVYTFLNGAQKVMWVV